jgi:hypothetical protein
MLVCVTLLNGEEEAKPQVVLTTRPQDGPATLEHEAHLGAGVRLALDLARPQRWRRLTITSWRPLIEPLLIALIGEKATEELAVVVGNWLSGAPSNEGLLVVDSAHAAPWLRVALADGLDRWLQLPLEEALLAAERAVARSRAALALPGGAEVRDVVINDALGLARLASTGVSHFLRELAAHNRPLPSFFYDSLQELLDGYAHLADQVSEPDKALSAVLECWVALSSELHVNGNLDQSSLPDLQPRNSAEPLAAAGPGASMINPHHMRARVFRLGNHPKSNEIVLSGTQAKGQEVVVVRVPAFRRQLDPEITQRLMARLVSRRSGDACSFALLTLQNEIDERTRSAPPYFECTIPLRGSTLEELRADVYDALFSAQQAIDDTEEDLQRVRRAVLLLCEWRGLAALAQLPCAAAAPARRLREIARLLQPSTMDGETEQPLFDGGPSATDLYRFAKRGDARLLRQLREPSRKSTDEPLLSMVDGPARPLVAELAAAYQSQAG